MLRRQHDIANKNRRASKGEKRRLNIESLERRELMMACGVFSNVDLCLGPYSSSTTLTITNEGARIRYAVNQNSFLAAAGTNQIGFLGSGSADRVTNSSVAALYADGRGGDDVMTGGDIADELIGGAGQDTIRGGGGDDTIQGGAGNDVLTGGEGSDQINGDDGNDLLYGDAGVDVLHGGTGNDVLRGGTGNDSLRGDAGEDEFYGDLGNDSISYSAGERVEYGPAPTFVLTGPSQPVLEGTTGTVRQVEFVVSQVGGDVDLPALGLSYSTLDGTAIAGRDYVGATGEVSWAKGNQSPKTVRVQIISDNVAETPVDETFGLRVGTMQAMATIRDDDTAVFPTVSIDNVSAVEGNSGTITATLRVSLSHAPTVPLTVTVNPVIPGAPVPAGVATFGNDYSAPPVTLTWQPGETQAKLVYVSIVGDTAIEPHETVTLRLANALNGTISTTAGSGVLTILNDDAVAANPTLTVANVSVSEGNRAGERVAQFVVTPSHGGNLPFSVKYATQDLTALATEDYVAQSGTLSWLAYDSSPRTINISLLGDAQVEPDESFRLSLNSAVNSVISTPAATATIVNDDSGSLPSISVQPTSVTEASQHATFMVTLSSVSALPIKASYTIANGSALAGQDFVGGAGVLTFTPGQTVAYVQVPLINDVMVESEEFLVLRLGNPQNATIAVGSQETRATIVNDDVAIQGDKPGVVRGINWIQDLAGDGGLGEATKAFGAAGGRFLSGDWDGNGKDDLTMVYFNSATGMWDWHQDLDGNGGAAERVISFGLAGDIPLIGDFTGDGQDDAAVARWNAARGGYDWYLDLDRAGGAAERVVQFGLAGDTPITGDFNGDGVADASVVRYNASRGGLDWLIDLAGDGYLPERTMQFGLNGDRPIVGDWNGDGVDDLGVIRGATWFFDMAGDGQFAERSIDFGQAGDIFVAGDWAGVVSTPRSRAALTVSGVTTTEGTPASLDFRLSAPATSYVTVRYNTANGTADSTQDYAGLNGTLVFAPGEQTKSLSITTHDDAFVESIEQFSVTFAVQTGLASGDGSVTVRVADNDAALSGDRLGVYRGRDWLLDNAGDGYINEATIGFGLLGDIPVPGDWNGDGYDELAVVRSNSATGLLDWYFDLNNDGNTVEKVLSFGLAGDTPVAGDWNNDGKNDMGVVRANTARGGLDWYFDLAGDGIFAERVGQFGLLGDRPIVGDWNGDGRDDMSVTRINQGMSSIDWYFDLAGDGGAAEDVLVSWGLASSTPVAGDWNRDGRTDVGTVRTAADGLLEWCLDLDRSNPAAEKIVRYGIYGDRPVVGNWR